MSDSNRIGERCHERQSSIVTRASLSEQSPPHDVGERETGVPADCEHDERGDRVGDRCDSPQVESDQIDPEYEECERDDEDEPSAVDE